VDDQKSNVLLLEQMLRNAGYDSISSTMEAGKVCELHLLNHYDLILLDLWMDGMDGFQVMENLRDIEREGYIPVIVITAHSDHKHRAMKAGAREFINKPVDLAEVLIRVQNYLEVRILQRENRKLYEWVLAEQKISERLLCRGTAPLAAGNDRGHSGAANVYGADLIAASRAEISLLFADIQAFNAFAKGAGAAALTGVLSEMARCASTPGSSSSMDRGKTLGDAYLAAMDLPDAETNHTIGASIQALDLFEAVKGFNEHGLLQVKIRILLSTHKSAIDKNPRHKRSFEF